jgi:hypothetical protein
MEFLYATGCNGLRNIAPLKGMPLKGLWLSNTAVDDLSALAGMPLSDLRFQETKVTDLTPLDGMAIQVIEFGPRSIKKGLHVLRNMKTLTQIHAGGGVSAAPEDFWKRYDAGEFK